MGNAVMGNMGSCFVSPGQVRVLQADGKMVHFGHPVLAIQVMQDHPGHLVIKLGPSSMSTEMIREENYASLTYDRMKHMGCNGKTVILRADEELDQKSTYYLLPIKANKKQAGGSWSCFLRALKNSGKVASSFEFEHKSELSSSGERKFSMLWRSRSLPRSRHSFHQVQQEGQPEEQPKPQQKRSPSVSFPPTRMGGQSLSIPFIEGVGRFRDLPLLQQPLQQNKRPRRIRRQSDVGWKPILKSISEGSDDFSDDADYSGGFYKIQSKCLRRLHSFESPIAHLRPITV